MEWPQYMVRRRENECLCSETSYCFVWGLELSFGSLGTLVIKVKILLRIRYLKISSPSPSFFLASVLLKIMLKIVAETQTGLKNERAAPLTQEHRGLRRKYGRWMGLMVRPHSRGTYSPGEKVPTH